MVSTREKRSEYFWLSGKALSYERTMPGSNEDCFSVLPEKEQEAKNRKDRKIPEFLIISDMFYAGVHEDQLPSSFLNL